MDPRLKRIAVSLALVAALGAGLIYLPSSLAESAAAPIVLPPLQSGAVLTTRNNQPITVNGSSAIGGATVMTGAAIETPDSISASLSLPRHFTLDISPNASLTVDFSATGIKVNLIKGCVVLHVKKGTSGEISTSRGIVASADGSKDARLDVCDPTIAAPVIPAATAGAASSTGALIFSSGLVAAEVIPIILAGRNPSPHNP